jgi:hypothetical protein
VNADVFLSYSRDDRAIAEPLANMLRQRGWSVFWDYDIRGGVDFDLRIKAEAQSARCVVVLWSRHSVKSKWVRLEAQLGASAGRLLPVLIERVPAPKPFATINAVDLVGWSPDTSHPGLRELLESVVDMIGGEPWKRWAFQLALRNVTRHGDTDVLPVPLETQVFADKPAEALGLLLQIDAKFDELVTGHGPYYEASPYPVGAFGYRWVTQIDPIWNAYLLGLVITVGHEIEKVRVPVSERKVFSYRFGPTDESGDLFPEGTGWESFQRQSLALTAAPQERGDHRIVVCDIADFYSRISHDHVRQALEDANADASAVDRICRLLRILSGGASYGLPVGGPAARLLSEVVLAAVDERLRISGVSFCRFADDYRIFATTLRDARQQLMLISETLFEARGLVLQKSKTRIMSTSEFRFSNRFNEDPGELAEDEEGRRTLLQLKIPFEVYSEDRVAKYEKLRAEINRYDLLGILARELAKTRPDPAVTRRLIEAIRLLGRENLQIAVRSLLEIGTLDRLYPVLPHLLRMLKHVVEAPVDGDATASDGTPGLDKNTREAVFDRLGQLITSESHLLAIPAHMGYAVRILVHDRRPSADQALASAWRHARSMVRRDVILGMAKRRNRAWLGALLPNVISFGPWERRALLVAAHDLGRVGHEWLRQPRALAPWDLLVVEWARENGGPEGLRFRL